MRSRGRTGGRPLNDCAEIALANPPTSSPTLEKLKQAGSPQAANLEHVRAELAAAWERGERPRIEDFDALAPPSGFNPLELWQLVREEIRIRHAAGDLPRQEEYVDRFGRYMAD